MADVQRTEIMVDELYESPFFLNRPLWSVVLKETRHFYDEESVAHRAELFSEFDDLKQTAVYMAMEMDVIEAVRELDRRVELNG